MKNLFIPVLLIGLISAFGSARADLRQQYSNQKGCVSYHKVYPTRDFCIDGNNNVVNYYPTQKRIGDIEGKIGEKIYSPGIPPYSFSRPTVKQFEIEDGELVEYWCNVNLDGNCESQMIKTVYPRVIR